MYLAVVFAAVIGKLYGRLRDRKNMFSRCYCEFLLLGCVSGFIILTMSRTAFLTISICTILVSALAAVTYKKRIKRVLQEFGILAATIIVWFPLVFSTVRMVPAIINDPVIYDLEYHDEKWVIDIGEPIYSDDYITVERFFTVLLGRFITEEKSQEASIYIKSESLLAFTGGNFTNMEKMPIEYSDDTSNDENDDENDDMSNGRLEIFRDYIKATEFKGHPKMDVDGKGLFDNMCYVVMEECWHCIEEWQKVQHIFRTLCPDYSIWTYKSYRVGFSSLYSNRILFFDYAAHFNERGIVTIT
jgi:hypothetical protein